MMSETLTTVLIIDDDELVLKSQTTAFRIFNYHVLSASSGRLALELISNNDIAIDVILLDKSMPDMNGTETLKAIRKINTDSLIIVVSGYFEAEDMDILLSLGANKCLQKPFSLKELNELIKSMLKTKES